MNRKSLIAASITLALTATACTSTPPRVDVLDEARVTIDNVQAHPLAEQVASKELQEAREALARSERHLDEGDALEEVRHDAYLALRNAEVAENRIGEALAERNIERSEAERNQVLLEARERDVDEARAIADARAREARLHEIDAQRAAAEADRATAVAQSAIAENRALRDELSSMETDFANLEAEQTARGMVLTLGDVLFDTDRATLKPGAAGTMDRLAAFLADHGERRLLIEGHTDARGDSSYNEVLSERRAGAVRSALLDRGVDAARLDAVGLGESYPVATNDSAAGRQENRRVEIIVSGKDGAFPAAARREQSQG